MWVFRRCFINGVFFYSKSYKRVVVKKDYIVEFYYKDNIYYGLIYIYVKVEERCVSVVCN